MKKLFLVLGMIFLLSTLLIACKTQTTVNLGLSFEKTLMAKDVDGKWMPVENQVFNKGDSIGLVFINVSGFKKDKNGLNWMDLDVEVKDSNGKVILNQSGLLGDSGKVDLEGNIAKSPVGSFTADNGLVLGKYTIKVTIHDKIGGGTAVNSRSFELE